MLKRILKRIAFKAALVLLAFQGLVTMLDIVMVTLFFDELATFLITGSLTWLVKIALEPE